MFETDPAESAAPDEGFHRPPILVPLAILAVLTGLIRLFDLDMKTAAALYGGDGSWPWDENSLVQFVGRFGTIPALVAVSVAIVVWAASAFRRDLLKHRGLAMYLVLVMAVGPGLVVNALFKEHYGRPRPRLVEPFGGDQSFLPVLEPDFSQKQKSFPCGEASMGFFWMCLGIFYWERNRRLSWGFLAVGLAFGYVIGLGRMAEGGHWLSDVLWAGGFIYLSSWMLYRALRLEPRHSTGTAVSHLARN